MQSHSRQELKESDEDFNNALKIGSAAQFGISSKNKLKIISVVELSDGSESEGPTKSTATSASPMARSKDMELGYFISKVISFSLIPDSDRTLFVESHKKSISYHSAGIETSDNVVDNKLTLLEFQVFVDYLERTDPNIQNTESVEINTLNEKNFSLNFTVFLNCLVFALKTKRVILFEESFTSSKIISFVNEKIQEERLHSFDILMNYFELLLLDLNESLISKKPSAIFISVCDSANFDYILLKILNVNLFDDLNYFLIRILIIVIRLNNMHHGYLDAKTEESLLRGTLEDLKDLENNQILAMYLPKYSLVSSKTSKSHSQLSSTKEAGSEGRKSSNYSPCLEFQSLKVQRFHVLYNYSLFLVLERHKTTYHKANSSVLKTPTRLLNFWNAIETDPFMRLNMLAANHDYSEDPFMSFIALIVS